MAVRGPDCFQLSVHVLRGSPTPSGPGVAPGAGAAGLSKGVRNSRLPPGKEIPVTRDVVPAHREGGETWVLSLALCPSDGIAVVRRKREGVLGKR